MTKLSGSAHTGRFLMQPAKTLIRLNGCWEFSVDAHVILSILSCPGFYVLLIASSEMTIKIPGNEMCILILSTNSAYFAIGRVCFAMKGAL